MFAFTFNKCCSKRKQEIYNIIANKLKSDIAGYIYIYQIYIRDQSQLHTHTVTSHTAQSYIKEIAWCCVIIASGSIQWSLHITMELENLVLSSITFLRDSHNFRKSKSFYNCRLMWNTISFCIIKVIHLR